MNNPLKFFNLFADRDLYKFDKPSDCPICLENITNELRPLNCGHWVHKDCLLRWNDMCPTCRSPVELSLGERKVLLHNTKKECPDNISASGGLNNSVPSVIEIRIDINEDEDITMVNFDQWFYSILELFEQD